MTGKWNSIEAVVKITERCNIDCTYCYVFNKGDDGFEFHPAYMGEEVVQQLAAFLSDGARDSGAQEVIIDFHGGEPLMMKKRRFDRMCCTLIEKITPACRLKLNLQTNGMLVDSEWIKLFEKYQVGVGVSLDGPEQVNDAERIDHNGKGTHARAVAGIRLLQQAHVDGRIRSVGLLSVAQQSGDAKAIYDHFVKELQVSSYNVLLPIDTHDSFEPESAGAYAKFLRDAFDVWAAGEAPRPNVRLFSDTIRFLNAGQAATAGWKKSHSSGHLILTIASNGDIGPDDSLRTANKLLFGKHNVATATLQAFLAAPEQRALFDAYKTLPEKCGECAWKNLCKGGSANGRIVNRFSAAEGFKNPSVLCGVLQDFYSHIAATLLQNGMKYETLKTSLIHDEGAWQSYAKACAFSVDGKFVSNNATTPVAINFHQSPASGSVFVARPSEGKTPISHADKENEMH